MDRVENSETDWPQRVIFISLGVFNYLIAHFFVWVLNVGTALLTQSRQIKDPA
jgi:hypothetical protein